MSSYRDSDSCRGLQGLHPSSSSRMASDNAIREEYMSSLADLDQNSKPMIDMLTMLADDQRQHAPVIVDAIKRRIAQVTHFSLLLTLS